MVQNKESPQLFSYIVVWDVGLAPNPYWGYCTLSCCKPQIRARARVDDLIVGLSSVRFDHKLIYAMCVTETLSFEEYYRDRRFRDKIPNLGSLFIPSRFGDNFYQPVGDDLKQLPSRHSLPNGQENSFHKNRDLGGRQVLISDNFHYLGDQAVDLPQELSFLKVRRGHRNRFTPDQKLAVYDFVESLPLGKIGEPSSTAR